MRLLGTDSTGVHAAALLLLLVQASGSPAFAETWVEPPPLDCPAGSIQSVGPPDPALFSPEASRGIQAQWCETYDADGRSLRAGPYVERYPSGRIRTRANYAAGRFEGPIETALEDGRPFLRGFFRSGEWSGPLSVFHGNGEIWLRARFAGGRLDGPFTTHHADGSLASETRFQRGREDGLARTFYPRSLGAGLRTEVHVEADELTGAIRRFSHTGELLGNAPRRTTGRPPAAAADPERRSPDAARP